MTAAVPAAAPHVPVLLAEVMRGLALNAGDVLVDGTFGAGGYTRAALAAGAGHVWAFDRDPNAIAEGRALEDGSDGRLTLIHDRFSNMVSALGARGVAEVDAVTFDIGVSSMQLEDRKSTRLNSSHYCASRMTSSA